MPNNIEIKARVAEREPTLKLIESVADDAPTTIFQWDTFFRCSSGRLKLRDFGNETGQLIAYHRPDTDAPVVSDYAISETHSPAELRAVLESSLGISGEVKKTRQLYKVGRTRIHLDSVEGLGNFLELEVVLGAEEEQSAGVLEAQQLMQALNIAEADLISCAYVDLLTKHSEFAE